MPDFMINGSFNGQTRGFYQPEKIVHLIAEIIHFKAVRAAISLHHQNSIINLNHKRDENFHSTNQRRSNTCQSGNF